MFEIENVHECNPRKIGYNDPLVVVQKIDGEWQILLKDGIGISALISYCPFCGCILD